MTTFNHVQVINPLMLAEPTWLDDIITARLPLLVLRGFIQPDISKKVIEDLENCREKIRVSHYSNGALTTLGPYLAKYTLVPENYFTELHDIQPTLPDSLISLKNDVYQWVMNALKLETLQTAVEPGLGEYSSSIVRFHANGVANPLHNDHIVRDAAGTGLTVTQIHHQLSCVACLQECDSGGVLRIYKKRWQSGDEQFKTKGELGYQNAVTDGCETCEFSPRRGDIYIFNPAYYHEIDCVTGETRITMGFFFGLTDNGFKNAIAWS